MSSFARFVFMLAPLVLSAASNPSRIAGQSGVPNSFEKDSGRARLNTPFTDATGAVWRKAGADEGLHQAFVRAAYSLVDSGHGTWRSKNPAQHLAIEFDQRGARLGHPEGSISFHLNRYGYGDRLWMPPGRTRLVCNGDRLEYQRRDLIEWYVNGSEGLEQGFTLSRRPGANPDRQPLVIALKVSGGMQPVQGRDNNSVLFESGNGIVLRYAGLKAVDASGRTLPTRLKAQGHEVRIIVEDRDARYPVVVDPIWTQQQELNAADPAMNDSVGWSVSVSGDTAVIGAPQAGGNGAAYVFVRNGGVWMQQQKLTASDGAAQDAFGAAVTVSGDTVIVGAYFAVAHRGAAYVFVRNAGVWTQQQKLTASDRAANFGSSVSVSGDTAMIGASHAFIGTTYVFARTSGVWSQVQELSTSEFDLAPPPVSISGDTAVIGTYNGYNYQGAAYVFVRNTGLWTLQQTLTAPDSSVGDGFGVSVSLSGDTAVIGTELAIGGSAFVFVRSGGVWTEQQKLNASDASVDNFFASTVSVSGDTVVIGAPGPLDGVPGEAFTFVRSAGVWHQQQTLTASDGMANDLFGVAVSASGNTAVVGAPWKNYSRGGAYVFVSPSPGPGPGSGPIPGPSLGTNSVLVGSSAGTSSVVLSSAGAWTAVANDSFLHISSGSSNGTESGVVVFTYDAFSGTGTRTGTLTIAGLTVTVTQAGTNYLGPGPVITLASSGLNQPEGLAADADGNVYFADTLNNAIKEWVASTQQVIPLVSSGLDYPTGVALDVYGDVYFADTNNEAVKEWSASTQQVTPLVSFGLTAPSGVALDATGNVYIADPFNSAIEEWNASTLHVTLLEPSALSHAQGVALDAAGNVYVSDAGTEEVLERNASTQEVTTLTGGLNYPFAIAVDGAGNVYIADSYNGAIKKWNAATNQVTTLLPVQSYGVAVDGTGNVYYTDTAIREIPNAFVGPASLIESAPSGSDSLLPVLPSTRSLSGIFAPSSDQKWLTIGTITNGVVGFSFTANSSTCARVAHIALLGHPITVTQKGLIERCIHQHCDGGGDPHQLLCHQAHDLVLDVVGYFAQ